MANARIGALRVDLGMNTAAFEKGADLAQRKLNRFSKSIDKMGKKLRSVGKTLTIGITAPLAAFGYKATQAAIDAEEMNAAFDVVFGEMSDNVRKWAEVTGDAMGRSTQEMQRGALAFEELFSKALDKDKSVELSKQFAVLTQDLASFKNLSNEVAQQKLFSGLTGEAEPLRAVGVFINDAAVKAKLLEMGLEKINGKYTDQQKILARAALIQEQLANAQGDVLRTQDSTANSIKKFNAALEELSVKIGQKILPVITPLINRLSELVDRFAKLSPEIQKTIVQVAALAAAAGPLVFVFGGLLSASRFLLGPIASLSGGLATLARAMRLGRRGMLALTASMAANPITLAATAIGVLAGAIVTLGRREREATRDTIQLIGKLRELGRLRGAEFGGARHDANQRLNELRDKKTGLEARRDELKRLQGFAATSGAATAQLKKVNGQLTNTGLLIVQLEKELELAERDFKGVDDAVDDLSDSVGNLNTNLDDGKKKADPFTDKLQAIKDKADPAAAALRQLNEEIAHVQQGVARGKISQDEADGVRLGLKLGHIGERGFSNDNNVIRALGQGSLVADTMGDVAKAHAQLTDRIARLNVKIAKSFKDMANETVSALQGLTNSLKNGGVLDILGAVVNLVLQLGSIGLFGKKIAGNINSYGGARAGGGPVSFGKSYLVGENGPELFTPGASGNITPNHAMGGGATYVFKGNLMTPEFWARIQQGDAIAASAGGQIAMAKAGKRNSRRVA